MRNRIFILIFSNFRNGSALCVVRNGSVSNWLLKGGWNHGLWCSQLENARTLSDSNSFIKEWIIYAKEWILCVFGLIHRLNWKWNVPFQTRQKARKILLERNEFYSIYRLTYSIEFYKLCMRSASRQSEIRWRN